ncbi:MAG: hypothetical protein NC432_07265 [Roseburia sp.]|nr:hypothetical protein [Roseburia sp.]MCM1098952.1 hypothetical protein [Ruminococcus flavefaciens]
MGNRGGLIERIRRRIEKDRRQTGLWIMDLAIGVLCLVMAGSLWYMIAGFLEERDPGYGISTLQSALTVGDYPGLLELSNANRVRGIGVGDADFEEYYAVADYFEAATNLDLCGRAGDAAGAEKWLGRLREAEAAMGVLSGERFRICEQLGISEEALGAPE